MSPNTVFVIPSLDTVGDVRTLRRLKTRLDVVYERIGDRISHHSYHHHLILHIGALINDYIKRGAIVPVEITIALLLKAMKASSQNKFLIDGFPRNKNNQMGWLKVVGDQANVEGVLFFDCSEEVMEQRLLKRGEDAGENRRKDDNVESIKKRFKTYVDSTRPVIDVYDTLGLVHKIDAERNPEEVFSDVKPVIEAINSKVEPSKDSRITMVYRLDSREDLQGYFDKYAAQLRGDAARFSGKISIERRIMSHVAEVTK